ncbi:WAT1-related protein At3g30340-like [Telopea speciosissima]|uniref:WAT1-related protein At3g30340-like n=1 Tax=Telopea speciosissima TaxID=54955 RepID=UPI001CC525E9|nr:WAT1-related protein At3g30340-like [Telopea speciosissima]
MAVIFRRESFRFCSINGQAKVWGISLSVLGTIAMVLYTRETIPKHQSSEIGFPATGNRFIGYLANLVSLLALGSLNVLLEHVTTKYQGDMSWAAMISFCGTLQTVAIAAFTDRSSTAWKIRLEGSLEVLTILYGGILMTGICFYATTWCIHKKGSVFASAFGPLIIIFSFLFESNFRKKVQFESIIGAALVVVGLYLLLWAKAKDSGSKKMTEGIENSTTKPASLLPLLGDKLDSCA